MIHIVDDNETVLEVMVELVGAFGYSALPFNSPHAYLEYASSNDYQPPMAAFVDVMMPGLDGFTLVREVRALHPGVRFVIMSGEDQTGPGDKGGSCLYLLKPVRFEKLEATFRHLNKCAAAGASRSLAGAQNDDRRFFGVDAGDCPHLPEDED